ncbi:MAG TPA: cyclic nucleotide-binding domain-containing protein [Burkholderiales bacterium]|nr:cyclic nucleotide-binding domain-containing protein [Burkholderiales bacterium]
MADATKLQLMRESALATELDAKQCAVLADLVTVRDLADGEVLVDEGASDDHVHTVVSGTLAVAKQVPPGGQWINLNVLTKGDLAGELAFMDGKPHYAALRAVGPTRILSLKRERLESLLGSEPLIVYRVMRAIFRVVHGILHRMALQASELTNYIYKQHGKY